MRHELILHTGPLGPAKRPEVETSDPAETWRPHDTNPEVEVNGRGQLRTKAPPAPPQPVWPFPVSVGVDTTDADETSVLHVRNANGDDIGKGCWGLSVSEIEDSRRLAGERTKKLRELIDNLRMACGVLNSAPPGDDVRTGTVRMAPYFRTIEPQEMVPELTVREQKLVVHFCNVFERAVRGADDRRGLLLLKIADELRRRDQHYSATLIERAAREYGF